MAQRYGNIVGWGKYLPERVLTNADLEQIFEGWLNHQKLEEVLKDLPK